MYDTKIADGLNLDMVMYIERGHGKFRHVLKILKTCQYYDEFILATGVPLICSLYLYIIFSLFRVNEEMKHASQSTSAFVSKSFRVLSGLSL